MSNIDCILQFSIETFLTHCALTWLFSIHNRKLIKHNQMDSNWIPIRFFLCFRRVHCRKSAPPLLKFWSPRAILPGTLLSGLKMSSSSNTGIICSVSRSRILSGWGCLMHIGVRIKEVFLLLHWYHLKVKPLQKMFWF